MAEIIDGNRLKYASYQEYVHHQDLRAHTTDDESCRALNLQNWEIFLRETKAQPRTLLDIGCRDACWFDDFAKAGLDCTGVEISKTSAAYARSKGRKVINMDAGHMNFAADQFDLILSNHSFEHLLDPVEVLRKCRTYLRSTGYMLIRFPFEDHLVAKPYMSHVRAYNRSLAESIFRQAGFQVVYFQPIKKDGLFILRKTGTPLMPVRSFSEADQAEVDRLMKDEWLRHKVDRKSRLVEKQYYIDTYLPEIKKGGLRVLDVGCGPSEFLELCRAYGNEVVGIDDPDMPGSQMALGYMKYARILHRTQEVPVRYEDFYRVFHGKPETPRFNVINSQGALNQILHRHIDWVDKDGVRPSDWRKCLNGGLWKSDDAAKADFLTLFRWFYQSLERGGMLMIYPNGSLNNDVFSRMVRPIAKECGFTLDFYYNNIAHRWIKDGKA